MAMIPLKVMPKMQHMSVSLVISGIYYGRRVWLVGFRFIDVLRNCSKYGNKMWCRRGSSLRREIERNFFCCRKIIQMESGDDGEIDGHRNLFRDQHLTR